MKAVQQSSCEGKTPYESFDAASKAAKFSARARSGYGKQLYPYRCRFCARFHVGNSQQTNAGIASTR